MSLRWSAMPLRRRALLFVIVGGVLTSGGDLLEGRGFGTESEAVVRVDADVLDFVVHHRSGWLSQTARVVTAFGSGWFIAAVVFVSAVAPPSTPSPHRCVLHRRERGRHCYWCGAHEAPRRSAAPGSLAAPRRGGWRGISVGARGAVGCLLRGAGGDRCDRIALSNGSPLAVAAALVVALAVGTSRVVLGVHWLSDVVSGWLLAAGWLLALIGLRVAFEGRRWSRG